MILPKCHMQPQHSILANTSGNASLQSHFHAFNLRFFSSEPMTAGLHCHWCCQYAYAVFGTHEAALVNLQRQSACRASDTSSPLRLHQHSTYGHSHSTCPELMLKVRSLGCKYTPYLGYQCLSWGTCSRDNTIEAGKKPTCRFGRTSCQHQDHV